MSVLKTEASGEGSGVYERYLKRLFDCFLVLLVLPLLLPLVLLLVVCVRCTSPGPAIHWSRRVGVGERLFWMPKLRTMRTGVPNVATDQLTDAERWVTPLGSFLRRTSLDELPQFASVLWGDMSLVGPRPALFNQDELVRLRRAEGVHRLRPGITGLAQIMGRDQFCSVDKCKVDAIYLKDQGFFKDVSILLRTVVPVVSGSGVRH